MKFMSLIVVMLGFVSLLAARAAHADGAFPDSLGIMAPAEHPHEILLATNFGLVSSIDDGQTWTYSCEQDRNSFATQYQLGAAPASRLFALSAAGLIFSDNRSCSWGLAGGALAGSGIADAFPDPTNPNRVLAIATSAGADGGVTYKVVESADGGTTFASARYTAAGGDILTGIESARAAAATIYMTLVGGAARVLRLGRSTDGGANWQINDLTALGTTARSVRLIAIDPTNAGRVYLRVSDTAGERLVISDDVGVTVRSPLVLQNGVMSAFVRTAAGTMLVAGKVDVSPVLYRSTDGAQTFQAQPAPPTLLGLTQRGATFYGAADNMVEDNAVFTSTDQGTTWQPLMSFDQIQAIDTCAKTICQADCQMRAGLGQWSADLCDAVPSPRPVDGGIAPAPDASSDAVGNPAAAASGCHCATASGTTPRLWEPWAIGLGMASLLWARRRGRPARGAAAWPPR
jgi:MYXO-CTERM domain-containing protein